MSRPSTYLARKQPGGSAEASDTILRTHLIDPEPLRVDNFDGFFADREAPLVALASEAMGMAAVGSEVAQDDSADDALGLDEEEPAKAVA